MGLNVLCLCLMCLMFLMLQMPVWFFFLSLFILLDMACFLDLRGGSKSGLSLLGGLKSGIMCFVVW